MLPGQCVSLRTCASRLSTGIPSFAPPASIRYFHTSLCVEKHRSSGRFKVTRDFSNPLTFEQTHKPDKIGVRKSWNSWNTSNVLDGLRRSETLVEDMFIRKFMFGTWHRLFLSEVIIKRRANLITVGGIVLQSLPAQKLYFLIGYTEELLGYILKCPVKIQIQTARSPDSLIIKYV